MSSQQEPSTGERRVAEQARRERWRVIERHLHSGLLTLIVALMVFVLGKQMDNAAQTARIDERVTSMSVEVGTLYRSADAARDMKDVQTEVVRITSRIEQVERRVDGIEQAVRRYPPDSREP